MPEKKLPDSLTPEKTETALEQSLLRGAEYTVDGESHKNHGLRDLMAVRRELQAEEVASRGNLLTRGFNPIPRRG